MDKGELRKLIAEGETEETLDKLVKEIHLIRNEEIENEVLLLSNRLKKVLRKRNSGIISEENAKADINQITSSVLTIINNLKHTSSTHKTKQTTPEKKRRGWILLFFLGVVLILILLNNVFNKDNNSEQSDYLSYWVGHWISYEDGRNGFSVSPITFKEIEKELKGISYNKNLHKSTLELTSVNDTLKGIWKNKSTNQEGEFEFIKVDVNNFSGHYVLNGIKRDWKGERFHEHFSHFTNVKSSPNNAIDLRTRSYLSHEDVRPSSLIGEIKNNTPLKFIEREKNSYKIAVPLEEELRIGYIPTKYSNESTLRAK